MGGIKPDFDPFAPITKVDSTTVKPFTIEPRVAPATTKKELNEILPAEEDPIAARRKRLGVEVDLFGDPIRRDLNRPYELMPQELSAIPAEREAFLPVISGFGPIKNLINGGFRAIESGMRASANDIVNLKKIIDPFSSLRESFEAGKQIGTELGERAETIGRFGFGIAQGIVEPVTVDPVMALSQSVGDVFGKDLYGYTPDEQLDIYRGALVNGLLMATSYKMFEGFTRPMVLGEQLGTNADDLLRLAQNDPVKMAQLMQRDLPAVTKLRLTAGGFTQGATEGVAAGYSLPGDEAEKANNAIVYGIMGGTLGGVFNGFKRIRGEYKSVSEAAGEMLRIRNATEIDAMMNYNTALAKAEALKVSNGNLGVYLREMYLRTGQNFIVRGLNVNEMNAILDVIGSHNVSHRRFFSANPGEAGHQTLFDLNIGPTKSPEDYYFFNENGFFPNQVAEWNGKKVTLLKFIGGDDVYSPRDEMVHVKVEGQREPEYVPRSEIRDLADGLYTYEQVWNDVKDLNLKGNFIREIKDFDYAGDLSTTSLHRQSKDLWDGIFRKIGRQEYVSETLEDVELIGIRYDRGAQQKVTDIPKIKKVGKTEAIDYFKKQPHNLYPYIDDNIRASFIDFLREGSDAAMQVIKDNDIKFTSLSKFSTSHISDRIILESLLEGHISLTDEMIQAAQSLINTSTARVRERKVTVSNNPHIPGTPKTYATSPAHVQGYAEPERSFAGVKGLFGDPSRLQVKKLRFKKLFVVTEKHHGINRALEDKLDLTRAEMRQLEKARKLTYRREGLRIEEPRSLHALREAYMRMLDEAEQTKIIYDELEATKKMNDWVQEQRELDRLSNIQKNLHNETGYQFWDQLITRILRKRGYDGLLMAGRSFEDSEIMDLTGGSIGVKGGAKKLSVFNAEKEVMHKDLYDMYVRKVIDRKKNIDIVTENDKGPKLDYDVFNLVVKEIADDLGLDTPGQIASLRLNMEEALREKLDDLLKAMKEHKIEDGVLYSDDVMAFRKLKGKELEINDLLAQAQKSRIDPSVKLEEFAATNAFIVDVDGSGNITLRDYTGTVVQRFNDINDAIRFINESGQSNQHIEIDNSGDNALPTTVVGGNVPPGAGTPSKIGNNDGGYFRAVASKVEKFNAALNLSFPGGLFFTPKQRIYEYLDTLFNTDFTNKLFFPTQLARVKADLAKAPWLQMIDDELQPLIKTLPQESRINIGKARESMSWIDVATRLIKNRELKPDEKLASLAELASIAQAHPDLAKYMKDLDMTSLRLRPDEIRMARILFENDIDIPRVFEFRRAVEDISKQHSKSIAFLNKKAKDVNLPVEEVDASRRIIDDEFFAKYNEFADKMFGGLDKDKYLEAAALFETIVKNSPEKTSLLAVTRLARSLQSKEISRAEFIERQGWAKDGPEVKSIDIIDRLYNDLADEFGIENRLDAYMNHYRLYGDGGYVQPSFRAVEEKQLKFISEMIRTGELDVYENDPVLALVRYISSGFNSKTGFDQVFNDASKYLTEQINGSQLDDRAKTMIKNVSTEYLSQIKGFPDREVQFVQSVFEKGFKIDELKEGDLPLEVRKDLINTVLQASTTLMVGFRPAQGIRDFFGIKQLYEIRHGSNSFWNGIRLAMKKGPDGLTETQRLMKQGLVPIQTTLEAYTPTEIQLQKLGKYGSKTKEAISSIAEAGLKYSLQPNVYSLGHAAIYLDRLSTALDLLTKAQRDGKGYDKAYKALKLNTYSLPVRSHFDALVQSGKMNEAAEYIGQITARETVFYHGYANSAYGGMTNFGRVASQLGSWPMWARTYMMNMMANSSGIERTAIAANAAKSFSKLWLMGQLTGINMATWYVTDPRNLVFGGGPVMQAMSDISQDEMPSVPVIPLAFKDYWDAAFSVGSREFNPFAVLLRSQGFKIDKREKSFIDIMMGAEPNLVK